MTIQCLEVAVDFEGFGDVETKINSTSQPPITDPKTGKPYDLDNPDLPVVKDHKFSVRYWSMPKTASFEKKYLVEHFDYFNHKYFKGALPDPDLILSRDIDASRMKNRGLFIYPKTIKLSPNLFNAPHEGWINNTLLHEMCHMYVFNFEPGPEERKNKGHGPAWRAAMRRCGLQPNQYDDAPNYTYMDKQEKQRHHKEWDPIFETEERLKKDAGSVPLIPFYPAVCVTRQGGTIDVSLVRPTNKKGDIWVVKNVATGRDFEIHTRWLFNRK